MSGRFDSLDRAPAGRPFRLAVAPDLPAGARQPRIISITVRASFDDGRTWHRLVLRRGRGRPVDHDGNPAQEDRLRIAVGKPDGCRRQHRPPDSNPRLPAVSRHPHPGGANLSSGHLSRRRDAGARARGRWSATHPDRADRFGDDDQRLIAAKIAITAKVTGARFR
jgi:hypothetical protein